MAAGLRGPAPGRAAREGQGPEPAARRIAEVRLHERFPGGLVHGHEAQDASLLRRERRGLAGGPVDPVEAAGAVPFGAPEQGPAVPEHVELVAEVHPGVRALREHDAFGAAQGQLHELERALVAGLPLHEQARAVRQPVDAGEVFEALRAPVEPAQGAVGDVHDGEAHGGVRPARVGIVLGLHAEAVAVDLVAVRDGDRPLVDADRGDAGPVRGGKPALVPVHLLGGDEVRESQGDGPSALVGEAPGGTVALEDPEVPVLHEGHGVAAGERAGVGHEGVRVREGPRRGPLGRGVEAMEHALHGEEQMASVGLPVELDDAAGEDAQALTARLLLLGQGSARAQGPGVHEQPARLRVEVVEPEVEALGIVVRGPQPGDAAAVGGVAGGAREGSGEPRRREQSLQRQGDCVAHAASSAVKAGRVRFSTPSAVTATSSSMRMPPRPG